MEEPISAEQPVEPIESLRPPVSSTFSAMRHRNFQLYFGGQLISNIGTWMQIIAQAWVVYQIGHSELTLGLVAFPCNFPLGWRDRGSRFTPQLAHVDPGRLHAAGICAGHFNLYRCSQGMACDPTGRFAGCGQRF